MPKRTITIISPYSNDVERKWFKGNLHNHTISSNGHKTSPARAKEIYQEAGYHFTALTDHDRRLHYLPWKDTDWNLDEPGRFVFIRGYEASHRDGHINCIDCLPSDVSAKPDDSGFIDEVHKAGGLAFLNHPDAWNGNGTQLYTYPDLMALDGLEVYSGSRARKRPCGDRASAIGIATDLWDECLSRGIKVWGFANPDCHSFDPDAEDSPFNGFNVVSAKSLTKGEILRSIRRGDFYASTGITVEKTELRGRTISIESNNATRITFIGARGAILKTVFRGAAVYDVVGNEGYVRVELDNNTPCLPGDNLFHQKAWLQPFFISNSHS